MTFMTLLPLFSFLFCFHCEIVSSLKGFGFFLGGVVVEFLSIFHYHSLLAYVGIPLGSSHARDLEYNYLCN
jgi:hypothetical protein